MQVLHVRLLGEFSLVYGDQPVTTVNTARLQALLAHLVLHRDAPQSRYHLAFQFWPDSTESQARTNLRKLFHQLHQVLPDATAFYPRIPTPCSGDLTLPLRLTSPILNTL